MPFEIVGLDFVGREGREEDMAGIDGNTFIGRNRPPRIAKASTGIENARNLVKTFMRDHGLNDRPAHVRSFNGDFLFRSGPRKSRQYYRVVNGTVSKTTADLKLGSPPMAGVDGDVFIGGKKSPDEREEDLSGVGSWLDIKKPTMSATDREMKVHALARGLGIQFSAGKMLSPKEFEKLTTQAGKELGDQELGKRSVLHALSRYGMGWSMSDGKTYWA
jgi:hypothetical protein